jgi:hypothetical protein
MPSSSAAPCPARGRGEQHDGHDRHGDEQRLGDDQRRRAAAARAQRREQHEDRREVVAQQRRQVLQAARRRLEPAEVPDRLVEDPEVEAGRAVRRVAQQADRGVEHREGRDERRQQQAEPPLRPRGRPVGGGVHAAKVLVRRVCELRVY